MHKLGWVHRNVYPSNIIVGDGPPLVGFEHAKKTSDHEDDFDIVRSLLCLLGYMILILLQGSPFFKALEVERKSFMYGPSPEKATERPVDVHEPEDLIQAGKLGNDGVPSKASSQLPPQAGPTAPAQITFHYNHLHDLESLWWVAVYFILKYVCVPDDFLRMPIGGNWDQEKQRKCAHEVFDSGETRGLIMQKEGYFRRQVAPVAHPAIGYAGRILESILTDLVERYTEVEKDPASIDSMYTDPTFADSTFADSIYEVFIVMFEGIVENRDIQDIELTTLGSKRDPTPPDSPTPTASQPPRSQWNTLLGFWGEPKTGSKGKHKRKPATVAHQYNLRPRPKQN